LICYVYFLLFLDTTLKSILFPYTTLFRSLYKRYYEIVYSFIIKYLKSSELAEDVCQNTFFKIWERRNDLKITSFKNFALTVARKDRKSTRLNSSHVSISYAVFCLKKNRVL